MRKKVLAVVLMIAMLMSIAGCGKTCTCAKCGEDTKKAYYGTDMSTNYVMCEECARKYWMPFPIENYRVR